MLQYDWVLDIDVKSGHLAQQMQAESFGLSVAVRGEEAAEQSSSVKFPIALRT
jgi:hypothetical protein